MDKIFENLRKLLKELRNLCSFKNAIKVTKGDKIGRTGKK
jgi:hypothetical protein